MAKDRMTTSSPEYKTMMLKKVYDYALKNTDSDRLTIKDIKAAQQALAGKKGGGMATRGMGAALKKGGMSKMKKKGGMSKGKKYI
jgi:hypothetical protein